MIASTVKRRLVDEAVHRLLDAHTTFPVGLVDAPDLAPDSVSEHQGYATVQPIPSGESVGPPAAPDADVWVEYDVTSIGMDRRQAAWVADEVRRVLLSRSVTGEPVHGLTVDGHREMGRSAAGGAGGVILLDRVYQSVESFRFCVTRTDEE